MSVTQVKVPFLTCKRCGHEWVPRKSGKPQCPICKVDPNRPRIYNKKSSKRNRKQNLSDLR